jgi:hypothetical protein
MQLAANVMLIVLASPAKGELWPIFLNANPGMKSGAALSGPRSTAVLWIVMPRLVEIDNNEAD